MKIPIRYLVIYFTIIALLVIIIKFTVGSLDQIRSEYMTAQVIQTIQLYLRENKGRWPNSPRAIESKQYDLDQVIINYKITSQELIENPKFLEKSITSLGGKFYTYPHYESDLKELLKTIQETNR